MRNNFYNKFKQFVKEKTLFEEDDRVLLAVSGGVDSVIMAHLFHRAGFKFAIAHCNFQLRGVESDADETFVKALAHRLEVPFFVKKFDTEIYAVEYGLSIQMAARDLRYAWFEELLAGNKYKYLATAHQKDDVAETVLLNLIKGSILKGLHGILPKSNNLIRPLLFASKEEIIAYEEYKKLNHREDKSNAGSKYQRNLIRNEVVPILRQINPALSETLYLASDRRHQVEKWLETYSAKIKKEILKPFHSGFQACISELKENDVPAEIFHEWIEEYGFNYIQVAELFASLYGTESKVFLAGGYRMVKDREFVSIGPVHDKETDNVLIEKGQSSAIYGPYKLAINSMRKSSTIDFSNPLVSYFDEEKLKYPLLVRKWEHGDSFKPFGLHGRKKVSDYLTELKVSFQEKENQLVVCSADDICWVVGKRIDDRFKVNEKTRHVLKIAMQV